MDDVIRNLDSWTDDATKQMLKGVVKRKDKFDKIQRFHLSIVWITIGVLFLYFFYLYKFVIGPFAHSFDLMFSAFVDRSENLYMLIFAVGLFGYMNLLKKKVDKAEKEFHAIRCEVIDKAKDLWKGEAWDKRHIVFKIMKDKYDINLFHENK
jgi:hypothetical protein